MVELRPTYGKNNSKYYYQFFYKRGVEVCEILRKEYKNCNYICDWKPEHWNLKEPKNYVSEFNHNYNYDYISSNQVSNNEYFSDNESDIFIDYESDSTDYLTEGE